MNVKKETKSLKSIITLYLLGEASLSDLNLFAWSKIDYYTTHKEPLSFSEEKEEGPFWYAIWQIQHLGDEDHESDGTLKKELLSILEFIDNEKLLSKIHYGKRPA